MKIRIEKKKTVTFNLINNNNLRIKFLMVTSGRNDGVTWSSTDRNMSKVVLLVYL